MSSTTKSVLLGIVIFAAAAATFTFLRSRPAPSALPSPETVTAPRPAPAADSAELDSLKKQLARERGARQRAEADAAELRNKPVPHQVTNVVTAPRKVEDVGKQAGMFLPAMAEMSGLSSRDPATLSADEKRRLLELQRDHAKLLGALPEITAYQDNPDEYGRFFRSMIQEAAGLDDSQAAQVEEYMRQRGTMMNQLGLNSAKEPTDPKLEEAWEERRDQFNEQTANGLKSLLPPGTAEKAGLSAELMEFLEMDFDKLTPKGIVQQAR